MSREKGLYGKHSVKPIIVVVSVVSHAVLQIFARGFTKNEENGVGKVRTLSIPLICAENQLGIVT
jgi:hypothetical protein